MTTQLGLFQTNITPERNCKVDDLPTYLASCPFTTISDFQYRPIKLDDKIKINMNQSRVPSFPYNYISLKRSDDARVYYYFIMNSNWLSSSTIELSISLDTVNTFWDVLDFTAKTKITRQHKDRFQDLGIIGDTVTIKKKVDAFDEGITPAKLLTEKQKIDAGRYDYNWYLIYKNKENLTKDTTVPIDCFCCAEEDVDVYLPTSKDGIDLLNSVVGDRYLFLARDNENFTFSVTTPTGTYTYTVGKDQTYKAAWFQKYENSNILYLVKDTSTNGIVTVSPLKNNTVLNDVTQVLNCIYTQNADINTNNIDNYTDLIGWLGRLNTSDYSTFTVGNKTGKIKSFNTIDRTDTTIVKIIKMPYAPFTLALQSNRLQVPTGWNYTNGYLKLEDLNTEFLTSVTTLGLNDIVIINKSIVGTAENSEEYETKLLNSSYHTLKYAYDNFEREILLERVNADNQVYPTQLNIKFKQSNNLSSNSLFDFTIQNGTYSSLDLYDKYLNVNRQNEVALYNSDYLEYIRNGINYDKKAKWQQVGTSLVGIGVSSGGAVASKILGGAFGVATAVSFATSAISSLVNTISNAISADLAIARKKSELQRQPASVSNTEDLNLLQYYNGNRLIQVIEDLTPETKQAIYNLFRLTGYACSDYAIPVFDSRIYYNFIQAEIDIDESKWTYGRDFLSDIKARFETGLTVYHKVNNQYDWKQEKENFEKWLLPTST